MTNTNRNRELSSTNDLKKTDYEGRGQFQAMDEGPVSYLLSFVETASLARMRSVSRFFCRKITAIPRFWHHALTNRGFSRESIEFFISRVNKLGNPPIDYVALFQRITQLNRSDLHIFSNNSRYQNNSMFWFDAMTLNRVINAHLFLACLCGNLDVLISFQKESEYFYKIAYLLGMANMSQHFYDWIKTANLCIDKNLISHHCDGLIYKGHWQSFKVMYEEYQSFFASPPQERNYFLIRITKYALACHDSSILSSLEETLNYSANTYIQNYFQKQGGEELYEFCCLSSDNNNFIRERLHAPIHPEDTVAFIFGLSVNRNLKLFKYLLDQKILTPNQQYKLNRGDPVFSRNREQFSNISQIVKVFSIRQPAEKLRRISLFQLVCHFGSLAIVKLLVEDYNWDTHVGLESLFVTPLMIALFSSQLAIADYLCAKGITPSANIIIDPDYFIHPLHFILKFDIITIQQQFPHLYQYTITLMNMMVTEEFNIPELIGIKLILAQNPFEPHLHALNMPFVHRQVRTVGWLLDNNINVGNRGGAEFFNNPIDNRPFSAPPRNYYSFCSLRDNINLVPKPTVNNLQKILTIFDSFTQYTTSSDDWLDNINYPEQYFFITDSLKFMLEHYSEILDVSQLFTSLINTAFRTRYEKLRFFGDSIKMPFIENKMLFNDFIMPFIQLGIHYQFICKFTGYSEKISVANQSSCMRILFLNERSWGYKLSSANKASTLNTLSCLNYFLIRYCAPKDGHLTLPERDQVQLFDITCFLNLIVTASNQELSLCNLEDALKRDALCLLLDQYHISRSNNEFSLIQALVNRKVDLKIADAMGQHSLDRVLNNKADTKLFELFQNAYSSDIRYFRELSGNDNHAGKRQKIGCP